MQTFIITITSDMQQQMMFHANNVTEALDKAKLAFTDSMVVGTPQGKLQANKLSDKNQIVKIQKQVINPPDIQKTKEEKHREKEQAYQKILDSVPD